MKKNLNIIINNKIFYPNPYIFDPLIPIFQNRTEGIVDNLYKYYCKKFF